MPITISSQHGLRFDFLISGVPAGRTIAIWVESSGAADVSGRGNGTWTFTFSRPYAEAGLWAYYEDTWAEFAWIWPFATTPAVDTVTPSTGPLAGGTTVRLEDTSANPGIYDRIDGGTRSWVTRVRVGSGSNPPQGTNLNIVNSKRLEFTTPAQTTAGNAPITLDYNIGSAAINNIATGRNFTYQAAPFAAEVVSGTALQVTVGVTQGLTGTAQARIYFRDPVNVGGFVTVTGNSPQATHTYSQPGSYQIDVTRVSDNVTTQVFYQTLPVASTITPSGGSPRGGQTVVITGQLLQTVTGVIFGSRPATGVQHVAPTQLDVITPSNTGLMPVRLQSTYGVIQTGLSFLYREMPVEVLGRGLQLTVRVGGIEDTTATVSVLLDGTQQGGSHQVTPSSPEVSIVLTQTGEYVIRVVRAVDGYTLDEPYATLPYIDSVTPDRGKPGTVVQLAGGLLQLVEEVWFDGQPVEFTLISDTLIEAVAGG